jgi:hypothetical protein
MCIISSTVFQRYVFRLIKSPKQACGAYSQPKGTSAAKQSLLAPPHVLLLCLDVETTSICNVGLWLQNMVCILLDSCNDHCVRDVNADRRGW